MWPVLFYRYDASLAQLCYRGYRHAPVQPQALRGHLQHVQKGQTIHVDLVFPVLLLLLLLLSWLVNCCDL